MPQIADTGFLVAYWNRADSHHRWARSLEVDAPLISCEAVLTEAAYLLGRPEVLLQMLVDGDLMIDFNPTVHALDLLHWLKKYADLKPGFADACVVRLAELFPRAEVLRQIGGISRLIAPSPTIRCLASFPNCPEAQIDRYGCRIAVECSQMRKGRLRFFGGSINLQRKKIWCSNNLNHNPLIYGR